MEIKCQCLTIIVLLIITIIQHSNAIDISNEILEVEKEMDRKFGDFFRNKRYIEIAYMFYFEILIKNPLDCARIKLLLILRIHF